MKRLIPASMILAFLLAGVPASAGFLAEQVDDGVFFVQYQRGQVLRGSIIWDREKKVQKRLVKKSHVFCVEKGYSHLKFPTLGEIARDDYLRTVWELGAGDDSQNTSQVEGTQYSLNHVHKTRKLLLLSDMPGDGFESCHVEN
jgi:hypothetical protein